MQVLVTITFYKYNKHYFSMCLTSKKLNKLKGFFFKYSKLIINLYLHHAYAIVDINHLVFSYEIQDSNHSIAKRNVHNSAWKFNLVHMHHDKRKLTLKFWCVWWTCQVTPWRCLFTLLQSVKISIKRSKGLLMRQIEKGSEIT